MNRFYKTLILLIEFIFTYLIFIKSYSFPCIYKQLFNTPCFACGLTRSFKALINLNILDSFKYNLLGLPIFILLVIINVLLVIDIIKNSKETNNFFKRLGKYYLVILIIIIINTFINIFFLSN